ncbi:unnamed protein product, partial [Ectocarpus sp. 12 AP-2014]
MAVVQRVRACVPHPPLPTSRCCASSSVLFSLLLVLSPVPASHNRANSPVTARAACTPRRQNKKQNHAPVTQPEQLQKKTEPKTKNRTRTKTQSIQQTNQPTR